MGETGRGRHRRAALFVDFENVYPRLCTANRAAGERFATDPGRWVRWIEQELGPLLVDDDQDAPRAALRRICYLDPARSSRHRPYFTRAGFRVVDCPALTSAGKNSADIHMVLDILDTLAHPSGYDEFIVLSADADFTPVLLRLREHDRRTAMLVSGPTAAALRAACDYAIPEELFLTEALDLTPPHATALHHAATPLGSRRPDAPGALPPSASTVGSATASVSSGPGVPSVSSGPGVGAVPTTGATVGQPFRPGGTDQLRRRMEAVVREELAAADEPLYLSAVAHKVRQVVGQQAIASRWGGAGTFSQFLATIADETLQVDAVRPPGLLRDPTRHPETLVSRAAALPVEIRETADRVNRILEAPLLSTEAYTAIFRALAHEGRAVAPNGQNEVERTSRDACAAAGHPVPRSAIHFVLLGYRYAGYEWDDVSQGADDLARAFADNILRLAADAQMNLTTTEQSHVRAWITGTG